MDWLPPVPRRRRLSALLALLLLTGILIACPAWTRAARPANSEPLPSGETPTATSKADDVDDLMDMDIEQLGKVDVSSPMLGEEVTTVSRQPSTVGKSPAAVFVITPEMIERSAATNIPDVLRMVPGVQVAQIDANKWAISIRGFNSLYAGKLLVQIDGRAVYSQFFSGVIWSDQDVVLQDVERIEVIRGPGATVWGANAVNGVINIITKRAQDTQGLLVTGGAGTEQRGFGTIRYGGEVNEDLYWRTKNTALANSLDDEGRVPKKQSPNDAVRQSCGSTPCLSCGTVLPPMRSIGSSSSRLRKPTPISYGSRFRTLDDLIAKAKGAQAANVRFPLELSDLERQRSHLLTQLGSGRIHERTAQHRLAAEACFAA